MAPVLSSSTPTASKLNLFVLGARPVLNNKASLSKKLDLKPTCTTKENKVHSATSHQHIHKLIQNIILTKTQNSNKIESMCLVLCRLTCKSTTSNHFSMLVTRASSELPVARSTTSAIISSP